jgi:hypothetical protein
MHWMVFALKILINKPTQASVRRLECSMAARELSIISSNNELHMIITQQSQYWRSTPVGLLKPEP